MSWASAGLLRVSWDEAWHLMERRWPGQQATRAASWPGSAWTRRRFEGAPLRHAGLRPHRVTVEYIADDRKKTSLDAFYLSLSKEQLAGIEAVAMDMWEPFFASTVEHVPDGRSKIVFDRFHVMKNMTEAVDAVRKWEHRRLQSEGDDTLEKTKYLWLYSAENLPESCRERFAALRCCT